MATITSKYLRNNMDKTLERVNAGEEIIVTHRYRKPVKLSLVDSDAIKKSRLEGLKAFDEQKHNIASKYKTADLKKLYKQHLEEKYGPK